MGLDAKSKVVELQPRDISVLRGLFESRVMTLEHIAALYFDSKAEAAKKRMQRLKATGFLAERPRRVNEPAVLSIARKGFELLIDRGCLSNLPPQKWSNVCRRARIRDMHLRHELDVMDVKAALCAALRPNIRYTLLEFSTWPLLFEFKTTPRPGAPEVPVKPDGFIRIHERQDGHDAFEHNFYLEVDRSHEVQELLTTKAACYASYYRSGGFAVRCGALPGAFKDYPFIVLMVFKSAERRNNAAERMLLNDPPIRTQTWLTTQTEFTTDPLSQIWITPKAYQDVTCGTSFEIVLDSGMRPYVRHAERERLVEERIAKHNLLGD
jgi:hypothetical protein